MYKSTDPADALTPRLWGSLTTDSPFVAPVDQLHKDGFHLTATGATAQSDRNHHSPPKSHATVDRAT